MELVKSITSFSDYTLEYGVLEVFENWLRNSNSERTKQGYSSTVKEFFDVMFNKKVENVTESDINGLNPISVNTIFVEELRRNNSNSTIKYKLNIILSFMKELHANKFKIDIYYLGNILSGKRLKDDSKLTNFMNINQYFQFKEWLEYERFKGSRHEAKGVEYAMLTEFLWSIGSRIEAVFNLKWSNIVFDEDGLGQTGWSIYVKDKGDKLNWKPISNEFYEKLTTVFEVGEGDERIFKDLSRVGFGNYMKEYFGDKKITPHSLKKGAVSYYYNTTHDIVGAQNFADHESIETTRRYIEAQQDRTVQGSSMMTNKEVNISAIEQMSKKELIEIIEGRRDLMFGMYYEAKSKGVIK